jgi:PAS domain S-box-containing protein
MRSTELDGLARLTSMALKCPIVLFYVQADSQSCITADFGVPESWTCENFQNPSANCGEDMATLEMPIALKGSDLKGCLCVLDRVPRIWTADDVTVVREFAQVFAAQSEAVLKIIQLERNRAEFEEKFSERELKLRAILDTEPECVKVLDIDGRLLDMNPAGLRMIDAENLDQVVGHCVYPLVNPPYREALRYLTQAVFSGESGTLTFEMTGLRGSSRWVETHAAPLRDVNGNVIALVSVTRDITTRRNAEHKQQQIENSLRETSERLRRLSESVLAMLEEDRRRVARELHDEIGQVLTAVSINLKVVKNQADPSLHFRLDESMTIVDCALQQVRNMSLELRPRMLDDFGLEAAVHWYVQRFEERTGIRTKFEAAASIFDIPETIRTTCFRVVQEALTNVARHAKAQNVCVELRCTSENIHLIIQDDGLGFDHRAAMVRASLGTSLGLLGMQERAQLIGGQLVIESKLGRGTNVRLYLPLPAVSAGAA